MSTMSSSIGIVLALGLFLFVWSTSSVNGDLGDFDRFLDNENEETKYVLKYDAKRFRAEIDKKPIAPHFVLFYAPWCTHCKNLAPTINQVAMEYNAARRMKNVLIVKVDCTVESSTCQENNVKSFPTLLFYANGLSTPVEYTGPRDYPSIVEFLENQLVLAVQNRFAHSTAVELTASTYKEMVEATSVESNYFVMFYSPICTHCQQFEPTWVSLAESEDERMEGIRIAQVNCKRERDLCDELKVYSLPMLIFYKNGRRLDVFDGPRDIPALVDFAWRMKSSSSFPGPEQYDDESAVVQLDVKTISKYMIGEFTFINFYKPWCHFSQALDPIWRQLASRYQGNRNIVIASVDCSLHQILCDRYKVQGYPTMKLFFAGQERAFYTGPHDFKSLVEFVDSETNMKEL